ncbi:ATPase family associated with various cellular activities (AAA) [Streptoalloteichus tenebrarius]|uniref:ATPase family associated with various cellular activities (AAA) n=1 Tax=Streptoalloteichus tenebrarius (strain ATCC 17920 / DSM 40477 / JCM 4838 / CBS 697.72 / NBRC 16177 / NCIMB 11028 / NRRL B-12390 / A12253. 1 / ISP 5477) TaxID=1933 RepID=A0ABT1HNV1_STRSD|nr:AAA family ATPase [Streptoalloteichus tenebrarius]MCP2257165.1 ATPase family associated with various cellular activities (AAA) [Streptoalloteichus tenebrarius]BFE98800.1 ATP-binding protein [Streptoalloteichus tenebrarius]
MTETGYHDSLSHLRDELTRVSQLLCAEVAASNQDYESGVDSSPEEYRAVARDLAGRVAERLAATSVPLRLHTLTQRFGLDECHRDVLLLCLLSEVDPRYASLVATLADDEGHDGLTVRAALAVAAPHLAGTSQAWSVFAREGPLLRHHLVVLGQDGTVRPDPRIARYLMDDDALDETVAGVVSVVGGPPGLADLILPPELDKQLGRLAEWLRDDPRSVVISLHGRPGSGRRSVAAALCADAGIPLLRADVGLALRREWPEVVRRCYREARLRGAALCWVGIDLLHGPGRGELWTDLVTAAEDFPGLTLLTTADAPEVTWRGSRFLHVTLGLPDFEQRRRLWLATLPPCDAWEEPSPDRDQVATRLANTFRLTPGQTRDACDAALTIATLREPAVPRLRREDLDEGCRRQCGHSVAYARRIEPRSELTLDDLVLPAASRRQLDELVQRVSLHGQVHHSLGFGRRLALGRGVVALFTGASGTGKTTAAELLARHQGTDLHKVNIAAIASKYVGETEKNLDRVFTDAEHGNAILFFDEADALFGRRGTVREARDRWANLEVSYLLQRVEEFEGVLVLATNLRQNIDSAFLRRLDALVDFPVPDADARLRIWRGLFPASLAPPPDDDLTELATRFAVAGGLIRNVVLAGTFRALGADPSARTVSTHDLVVSMGREYQKFGLPITPGEFGQRFYGWVERELLLHGGPEPDGEPHTSAALHSSLNPDETE